MIKLYIACSLDGYIAKKDNDLTWLTAIPNPDEDDHGYFEFYESVDTVVMGRTTYEEILGFGVGWPYESKNTIVLSSNPNYTIATPNTTVKTSINDKLVEGLKKNSDKGIWIVGGSPVIKDFMDLDAIDEYTISIVPIILGEGIPLFKEGVKEKKLKLRGATTHSTGITNLYYKRDE